MRDIVDLLRIIDPDIEKVDDVLSTGSISLDLSTDIGGLPFGRIVTIYGPGGSGKTTLAMHIVSNALKNNKKVLYVDMEATLDAFYLQNIIGGRLDTYRDRLFISVPDSAQEILTNLIKVIKDGVFDVIIFDSVGSIISDEESGKDIGDRSIATIARLLSPFLRSIAPHVRANNILLVLLNQVRAAIGSFFTEYSMPGGNVLNHQSSMIIELYPTKKIKDKNDNVVGIWSKATVKKNKVGRPFRTCKFPIIFGEGVDYYLDLVNIAKDLNIIKKRGVFYSYIPKYVRTDETVDISKGVTLGRGVDNTVNFLYNNPEIAQDIEQQLKDIFLTYGGRRNEIIA